MVYTSVEKLIGNTPLLRLEKLEQALDRISVKVEPHGTTCREYTDILLEKL